MSPLPQTINRMVELERDDGIYRALGFQSIFPERYAVFASAGCDRDWELTHQDSTFSYLVGRGEVSSSGTTFPCLVSQGVHIRSSHESR